MYPRPDPVDIGRGASRAVKRPLTATPTAATKNGLCGERLHYVSHHPCFTTSILLCLLPSFGLPSFNGISCIPSLSMFKTALVALFLYYATDEDCSKQLKHLAESVYLGLVFVK